MNACSLGRGSPVTERWWLKGTSPARAKSILFTLIPDWGRVEPL
jgi:hypothetical protein